MKLSTLHAQTEGKCRYCGRQTSLSKGNPALRASREHTVPLWMGGRQVVLACVACNTLKGGLTDAEFVALYPNGAPWAYVSILGQRLSGRKGGLKELRAAARAARVTPTSSEPLVIPNSPERLRRLLNTAWQKMWDDCLRAVDEGLTP